MWLVVWLGPGVHIQMFNVDAGAKPGGMRMDGGALTTAPGVYVSHVKRARS